MCIINQPVEAVSNTKLFVAPNEDRTRQLTVYSNKVATAGHNEMILPCPYPESITFHSLEGYKNLFVDLEQCFPRDKDHVGAYRSGDGVIPRCASFSALEVHKVGSYLASIVPRFEDFGRLDASVFSMNPQTAQVLQDHYSSSPYPMGFIICKLNPGNHDYHPFAYSHQSTSPDTLFFPTRHFHPEPPQQQGDPYSRFRHPLYSRRSVSRDPRDADDWDHVIYSVASQKYDNSDVQSVSENRKFWSSTFVDWHKLPADYQYLATEKLNRVEIKYSFTNCDLISHAANPIVDIHCGRCDAQLWTRVGTYAMRPSVEQSADCLFVLDTPRKPIDAAMAACGAKAAELCCAACRTPEKEWIEIHPADHTMRIISKIDEIPSLPAGYEHGFVCDICRATAKLGMFHCDTCGSFDCCVNCMHKQYPPAQQAYVATVERSSEYFRGGIAERLRYSIRCGAVNSAMIRPSK